jgi:hypothetical protein
LGWAPDQTDGPPQRSPPRPASQSLDVRPRALVHGVVDGYDDLHVWSPGIMVHYVGLGQQGVRGIWQNVVPGETGSVVNGTAAI